MLLVFAAFCQVVATLVLGQLFSAALDNEYLVEVLFFIGAIIFR